MESAINTLMQSISNVHVWGILLQGFTIYILISLIKKFANGIIDYLLAKWSLGPSCKVRYGSNMYFVKSVGLFNILLEDEELVIYVSTSEWKKFVIVISK